MSTLTAQIQLRRDTAANWASNNPILAAGEVAFTSDAFYSGTDQQRFKIGDGVQTWSQLDYVPQGGVDEISELQDVNAPSPSNNDGLFYSSGTTKYENKSIATALGYTPANASNVGYTLLFTAGVNLLISPADATTYYFGSGRFSIYSPDHAVIIPKAGTLKSISLFHVVNSTLGTSENSTLSIQVRNAGFGGAVSTTTQITNTYKFNSTYNSTMFTGFNIDLPEGCAVDIKWLTPTWATNPAQININATLFIQ